MDTNEIKLNLSKIDDLSSLVAEYETKLAAAIEIRSQVGAVKTDILTHGYYLSDNSQRITDQKYDYQLSENHFNRYLYYVDQALKANGIKPAIMAVDICPALVAESHLRGAKRSLAEVTAAAFGTSADKIISSGLDLYDRWIDLICKLSKTLI